MHSSKVLPLVAATAHHDAVAVLLRQTWPAYYGPEGPGDAGRDVANRSRANGWPAGFVALAPGPVGTVTLAQDSFGAQPGDDGLWLIGLAVAPAARGAGIGSALVAAAEDYARATGAKALFSTTQNAAGIFRRRDWRHLRQLDDADGSLWQVYTKAL